MKLTALFASKVMMLYTTLNSTYFMAFKSIFKRGKTFMAFGLSFLSVRDKNKLKVSSSIDHTLQICREAVVILTKCKS